jgi:hypothetical protein
MPRDKHSHKKSKSKPEPEPEPEVESSTSDASSSSSAKEASAPTATDDAAKEAAIVKEVHDAEENLKRVMAGLNTKSLTSEDAGRKLVVQSSLLSCLWCLSVLAPLVLIGVAIALLVFSVRGLNADADQFECFWRPELGLCVWAIVTATIMLCNGTINFTCAVCNRSRWLQFNAAKEDEKDEFFELVLAKKLQSMVGCFLCAWLIMGCVTVAQVSLECREQYEEVWGLSIATLVLPISICAVVVLATCCFTCCLAGKAIRNNNNNND